MLQKTLNLSKLGRNSYIYRCLCEGVPFSVQSRSISISQRVFADQNGNAAAPERAALSKSWSDGIERLGRTDPMPQPVSVIEHRERVKELVPNDHPLYAFFYSKETSLPDPSKYGQHGRAWTVQELRSKSFDDLLTLWWLCIREINIHNTFRLELKRIHGGQFGFISRKRVARRNMARIKFVLSERYKAWDEAVQLLEKEGISIDESTGLFLEKDKENQPDELSEQLSEGREFDSIYTKRNELAEDEKSDMLEAEENVSLESEEKNDVKVIHKSNS